MSALSARVAVVQGRAHRHRIAEPAARDWVYLRGARVPGFRENQHRRIALGKMSAAGLSSSICRMLHLPVAGHGIESRSPSAMIRRCSTG
jgi:hypothetical protein